MQKHILEQYTHVVARIGMLETQISRLQKKLHDLTEDGHVVSDSVTCGKRGKRPLRTVKIKGVPLPEIDEMRETLMTRLGQYRAEGQRLVEMRAEVEAYIAGVGDIEIRNLLTLHYVDRLTWVQVAHRMNDSCPAKGRKIYTEDSCRRKTERFLEKSSETTVPTVEKVL